MPNGDSEALRALRDELASGDEGGSAALYRRHHFEHMRPDSLRRAFGTTELPSLSNEAYLAALRLVRVGIYPEQGDAPVAFDFRIGSEADTNYVLSVQFDARGAAIDVTMES